MNKKSLLILAGTVLLSGCLSNSSKPSNFYVMNPDYSLPAVIGQAREKPVAVEITALHLPPYLDRKQIVTRYGEHQLHFSELHRWGGKLHKNLSRILAKNLAHQLSTTSIAVSPHSLPVKPEYLLEVEVMQFEKDANNSVVLSAQWRLSAAETMQPITSGFEDIKSETTVNGDNYQAIVASMSHVFARFTAVIARAIADQE